MNKEIDVIQAAQKVFDSEILALEATKKTLGADFEKVIELIATRTGKVIVCGIGKSGHIGGKIAASFSSLGTPSFFLDAAEAAHGDLGMIEANDIVIGISFSGETGELIALIPNIKMIGARLLSITGNSSSSLAKHSDIALVLPKISEADPNGLAPSSSSTATLAIGDALAIVVSQLHSFSDRNFSLFHPAGALGKKLLLKVSDLMVTGEEVPVSQMDTQLAEALLVISKRKLGLVNVLDAENRLYGVITDGDVRRVVAGKLDVYKVTSGEIATPNPIVLTEDLLAINALEIMVKAGISAAPVFDKDKNLVGTIASNEILKTGITL